MWIDGLVCSWVWVCVSVCLLIHLSDLNFQLQGAVCVITLAPFVDNDVGDIDDDDNDDGDDMQFVNIVIIMVVLNAYM